MKEKVSCEIIKDLLPGYVDNVLSNDGKRLVSEHIINCESCKSEYEKQIYNLDIKNQSNIKLNYLKKISNKYKIVLFMLLMLFIVSSISLVIYSEPNVDEGINILLMIGLLFYLIVVRYIIPLLGFIYGILQLKKTKNKKFIIQIVLCVLWLTISVFMYIYNYLNY